MARTMYASGDHTATVGYGDRFPVTTEGRAAAVGGPDGRWGGVAGCSDGLVRATWPIDRVSDAEHAEQAATRRDVAELREQLNDLTREIRAYRASSADHGATRGG